MGRRVLPGLVLLLALSGCVEHAWLREQWASVSGDPAQLPTVSSNPFVQTNLVPGVNRTAFSQASLESAARVDTLGRNLVAANPQLGVRPQFLTIGGPQPEIFHLGSSEIYVTEGLVKQCSTDGQLAAVLCSQLGKLVAAREALAGPGVRNPERPLPLPQEVRVGNDHASGMGAADLVHRAELLKYEKDRRQSVTAPPPPPDSRALAREYLRRANVDPAELDGVAPLLQAAAENNTYARQLTGTPPARPWTK